MTLRCLDRLAQAVMVASLSDLAVKGLILNKKTYLPKWE
ncbi:MAG: hypothetical protein ACI9LY_001622 [Arenicella sp.]|jgi:hypothetical protein|nr:hypothetical protein R615_04660 [Thalassolituus oleivorans R6-15]